MKPNLPVSHLRPASREKGVALVITLILLSVIAFLAITFLVISQRERGSVTATSNQTEARYGADSALESAKAQILARVMAFTNQFNYGLWISTNFVNINGFNAANGALLTNVSYQYLNGAPLNANDAPQNLANLLLSPRPPVFVTNRFYGSNEFRFYLDLNRSGRFDPTGYLQVVDKNGNPILDSNGVIMSNYFIGDPQWIGILERPELPHSSSNKFIARYAYVIVPVGKTLDINALHNSALDTTLKDGNLYTYMRNQGPGSWEINFAAFLRDLNTNFWDYDYAFTLPILTNSQPATRGFAFDDARSLLRYRYATNYNTLQSISTLYGNDGDLAFRNDTVDGYSDGPLMTGTTPLAALDGDRTKLAWAGADNINHLFSLQDFFKIPGLYNPTPGNLLFGNRLLNAGLLNSSDDRYTYYRLLSLLGTDSSPEPTDRVNLNFVSVGGLRATNFISWSDPDIMNGNAARRIPKFGVTGATLFFTNAADKLLRALSGNNATISNIVIWPTNQYTPNVHRLLQLAANLYDATTNRTINTASNLPSVFRPLFRRDNNGNILIVGYREVENADLADPTLNGPMNPLRLVELETGAYTNTILPAGTPIDPSNLNEAMVSGVPLIIGAKKGLPNFNEFSMRNDVQVSRRLEFRRRTLNDPNSPINETNQMFTVSVTNVFGVEAWNSYLATFPRKLQMSVGADVTVVIKNELGSVLLTNRFSVANGPAGTNLAAGTWFGSAYGQAGFRIPLVASKLFLTNSTYVPSTRRFVPLRDRPDRNEFFYVPRWWLNLNTRLRFFLVDTSVTPNRILDFVNLNASEETLDITDKLQEGANFGDPIHDPSAGGQWNTNRQKGSVSIRVPTDGIINQILAARGEIAGVDWNSFSLDASAGRDRQKAIDSFRAQFDLQPLYYPNDIYSKSNIFYAPLVPFRVIYQNVTWQANDALVHYTVNDLLNLERGGTNVTVTSGTTPTNSTLPNLRVINERYEPWGGRPGGASQSPTKVDLTVKDPLVRRSDDWDFPTNKLPNIGWLGRIHRGTPWQTVYLKSPGIADLKTWKNWTGNGDDKDAANSQPVLDRVLFDLFTVAPNENATRGQLSVNQTEPPPWSAIFAGVLTLTNTMTDDQVSLLAVNNPYSTPGYTPAVIDPIGVFDPLLPNTWPPLLKIVDGINRERANTNNHPRQVFERLGDILSVPELTVNSPFLNTSTEEQRDYGLTDEVYERLPQQVLSLLRGGEQPKFAVYAYGQSLKPANKSVIMSGPYRGMCTNYQITGEVATRSIVRIEGAPEAPRAVVESFNPLPPE